MDWSEWIGKNVFIKLKTGDVYNCRVLETDKSFLKVLDKFGYIVIISLDQIIKFVEDNKNGKY